MEDHHLIITDAMSNEANRIACLLVEYFWSERKKLSKSQTKELNEWKNKSADNLELFEEFQDQNKVRKNIEIMEYIDKKAISESKEIKKRLGFS